MIRITAFVCLVSLAVVHCKPEKYTTKYDNVDLDEILKSDRLIQNYYNCLMTGNGCTPDGKELRKDLPDALKNGCANCSQKQKEGSKKIINFILKNKKDLWNEIEKKYDPEGTYRMKYANDLKKIQE